jgi:hypothetical protein
MRPKAFLIATCLGARPNAAERIDRELDEEIDRPDETGTP